MKKILPFIIIIASVTAINFFMKTTPKSGKGKKSKKSAVFVETKQINAQSFTPYIESFGFARPAIKTSLISQVSGKVISLSDNFKSGAFFKKDELLVQVEDVEYQANVKIAQSKLILAQQKLLEAKAYTSQAKFEWGNQGTKGAPSDLVLKLPQLRSAQTDLSAAEAELDKAKLFLSRTKIIAPYNGRIIDTDLSVAQVINNNTLLANIYATDNVEIYLPIKNKDLFLLDLKAKNQVVFDSKLSKTQFTGSIVRTQSTLDSKSKQLYVIAKVKPDDRLQIGEYLSAKISIDPLYNSLVVPTSSIYQGQYVYVEKDKIITKRNIEISWYDAQNSLISKGINSGENIVTTKLGSISSGTAVKLTQSDTSKNRTKKATRSGTRDKQTRKARGDRQ